MKIPQRLLQFGALSLFSSMIGGLVLFRGGVLESKAALPQSIVEIWRDSLQPPWFDSVQFKQVLQKTIEYRLSSIDMRMLGSKSAPPAPPPAPKKHRNKGKSTEISELAKTEAATKWDSLIAMNILRTSYELRHLSEQEAIEYQQIYKNLLIEINRGLNPVTLSSSPYGGAWDSSFALAKLKYGTQQLSRLSTKETVRFQIVLDSLMQPRMMSTKSGLIFTSMVDTMEAIRIVKEEKRSQ